MSTYIKISTLEYPRHIGDIQRDSAGMADYALVQWTDPPAVSQMHRAVQKPPVKVGEQWIMAWEVQVRPLEEIVALIQKRLDDFAATRNYSSLDSISKYKDISDAEIDTLPGADRPLVKKFRTECRHLALATAQTWAVFYRGLAEVEAGNRPMPGSFAEIEAELPALVWPEV